MRKMPWFKFYADSFVADTVNMTACEIGSYMLALCWCWRNGALPSDESECFEIMKMRGVDPQKSLRKILRLHFVSDSDGGWVNRKMNEIRGELAANLQKRQAASAIANDKRWAALREAKANGTLANYLKNQRDAKVKKRTFGEPSDSDSGWNPKREVKTTTTPIPLAGNSPRAVAPSEQRRVSHSAPMRKAAMRQGRLGRVARAQAGLPLTEVPATQPASVSAPAFAAPVGASDPRFEPVREEIRERYWPAMVENTPVAGKPCVWTPQADAALAEWLEGLPREYGVSEIRGALRHRAHAAQSGVRNAPSATQPPEFWVGDLSRYLAGPVNRFGDPISAVSASVPL